MSESVSHMLTVKGTASLHTFKRVVGVRTSEKSVIMGGRWDTAAAACSHTALFDTRSIVARIVTLSLSLSLSSHTHARARALNQFKP